MAQRSWFVLWLVVGALPAGAWAQAGGRVPDTAHVVVVATTDVHGRAMHVDYEADREAPWGLTRAATAIDSLRRLYPGSVVLVDAGDLLQGNLWATYAVKVGRIEPNPMVDALNFLGYDAATPGNHDFDFGPEVFVRAAQAATFAYVSANVSLLPRDSLLLVRRSAVVRRGAVRVGITGLTTPGVNVWDRAQLAGRVAVGRPTPAVLPVLQELATSADLTIVLAHSGLAGRSSYDTTGVGAENMALELSGVRFKPDLVVVGHSHRQIRDTVIAGVHFVQPLPWARSLAVVHLWLVPAAAGAGGAGRERRWRTVQVRADQVSLADVVPDGRLVRRLATMDQQVRAWAATPLAETDEAWTTRYARVEDTPLVDWVNQVQRQAAGAQLSATAAFNLGVAFGPGTIRVRDVAALYPYENTLKAVRIDGATLARYLEQSAGYFRTYAPGGGGGRGGPAGPLISDSIPGYNYDMVSGISYVIDLSRPVGSRIVQLTYQGRLVQPTDTFTLALNNYRQAGGGGFDLLARLPVVYDRGEDIRDLLIEALRRTGRLRAAEVFTPSWRIVPPEAAAALRRAFEPVR